MNKKGTVPTASIPYEKLGPPGIHGELHILAILEKESRNEKDRLNDTSLRKFNITARLAKTPPVAEDIKGDFTPEDGGSFLLTLPESQNMRVRCPYGVFEFKKNSKGEHSQIEFECETTTTAEAKRMFLNATLPFIDFIAYRANCPIHIATIKINDPKNDRQTIEYISPYRKVIVNPHSSNLLPELEPVFALYREAKNSHSDFYKFLCYHKLLEGLLGTMRSNLFKRAKDSGIKLTRKRDVIPNASDLEGKFKEYVGKPIKEFFDNILTPRFRNAVAHFITDDGAILNMSSPEHIDRYAEVLYITELSVRAVIDNYEAMVKELYGAQ